MRSLRNWRERERERQSDDRDRDREREREREIIHYLDIYTSQILNHNHIQTHTLVYKLYKLLYYRVALISRNSLFTSALNCRHIDTFFTKSASLEGVSVL